MFSPRFVPANLFLLSVLLLLNAMPALGETRPIQLESGSVAEPVAKTEDGLRATIRVEAVLEAIQPPAGSSQVFCQLVWKDEEVAKVQRDASTDMKTWAAGTKHTEVFELPVPFCAPDGDYEVRVGFADANLAKGEAFARVGSVRLGTEVAPVPWTAKVSDLQIPSTLKPGESCKGSARVVPSRDGSFDGPCYLAFWKDGILWAVQEGGKMSSAKWKAGEEQALTFDIPLEMPMPEGEYQVSLGIHRFKTEQKSMVGVKVSGTTDGIRTLKPLSYGSFLDRKLGQSHFWYVNRVHALIWDGKPYIPIGGMITSALLYDSLEKTGDFKALRAAWEKDLQVYQTFRDNGVVDVYVNPVRPGSMIPTWMLQFYLDQLEEMGFVYGVQTNRFYSEKGFRTIDAYRIRANKNLAPYKVEGIKKSQTVTLPISNKDPRDPVKSCEGLYILIDDKTGAVVDRGEAKVTAGAEQEFIFSADVKVAGTSPHTLYFQPLFHFTHIYHVPNFWDHLEGYRKLNEEFSAKLALGPGFRFFIDPTRNESHMREGLRFTGPKFNAMFAGWLEKKYGNLENLNAAWLAAPRIPSFQTAAVLIPLYTGAKTQDKVRGKSQTSYYIDPENKGLFTLDAYRGIAWDDYLDFRIEAFMHFNNMVADSLKKYQDVPVVYKHVSHTSPGFINTQLKGGFDGIGSQVYGKFGRLRALETYHYSAAEHFTRTSWLAVTEINTEENGKKKVQSGVFGYPDQAYMHEQFDTVMQGGAKGIYDFLLGGGNAIDSKGDFDVAYSYVRNPKLYPWLKEYREKVMQPEYLEKLAQSGPDKPYYYYYTEYDGNVWWIKPNNRSMVLPNDDITNLQTAKADDGHLVGPCYDPNIDTPVLFVNLEDSPATASLGAPIRKLLANPPAGKKLVFVGLRNNLGALPELDRYFTEATTEVPHPKGLKSPQGPPDKVQILQPTSTSVVLKTTQDGKPWALRDGNIWIIANRDFAVGNGLVRFAEEFKLAEPVAAAPASR